MQSAKAQRISSLVILIWSLFTCLINAELTEQSLSIQPAVELVYETQRGSYYQLQIKKNGNWENRGYALLGKGQRVRTLHAAGEYRVVKPSQKWVQVWGDEFNGDQLDFSKWEKEVNNYGGGNNEAQAYRNEAKYCSVSNGLLHINVYRDAHTTSDGKTQPYSSARIRSLKRGDWKYGRFEIYAKMPSGQGIWPAVWMLPTDSKYGGWASGGEIDIIESRGSKVEETTGALHFGGQWPRNTYLSHRYQFPKKNAAEDFHLYTLEWSEDEIKWLVDGKLCKTRSKEEWFSEAAKKNPRAPYDQLFHLLINVAVDGNFFKGSDQRADKLPVNAFPQTLLVDYVRVYQWAK